MILQLFFMPQKGLKRLVLTCVLTLTILLSGCLTSSRTDIENGTLAGKLPHLTDSNLIVMNDKEKIPVKTDAEGNFVASLRPGRYQLMFQSSDGNLELIQSDIQIENNLTFRVTDVKLIPAPNVVSVSVPLLYDTSAVIEWETDIESDGHVEYGTSELYGYSSYAETELKKKHRIQLYELLPDTTYHFRIAASRYNLDSTRSFSRDFAFTTEP
ncbi:MAG: fibronectin type III domain-containing protein [Candidatus Rifleibacteriota bacterium]